MTGFAIMPFAPTFDDVYRVMGRALKSVDDGLTLVRLDEIVTPGRISDDLVAELQKATLCIADVTGANPNVMWEVGFAAALSKPTVAMYAFRSPVIGGVTR